MIEQSLAGRRLLLGLAVWWATSSLARADDLAALALADNIPAATPVKGDPWAFLCEGMLGWDSNGQQDNAPGPPVQRLSCDTSFNKSFAEHWQAVFANRIDVMWAGGQRQEVDTLREAYLDWRLDDSLIVDAGRINEKIGVGFGYNPTDYFKNNSIRDVLSVNPDSLRSSRLGTAMLRGQALWADGSVGALFAPKIAKDASEGSFNPDFGATNGESRWMVFGNQKISADLTPQWLVYGSDSMQPQLGLNLTKLLNQATVGYIEWSGGHEAPQYAKANGLPAGAPFQNRLAAGLTYTTSAQISLTFEYEYNAAALGRAAERRAIAGNLNGYYNYLGYQSQTQELSTRQAWFMYVSWNNMGVRNLNLNLFERYAPADSSRVTWGQLLYRFPKLDVSIERLIDSGSAASAYGNTSGTPRLQMTFAYYF